MPADLEAFAAGDDDAIWRRPQRRRLRDPRPVVLVPGVANRDARTAYTARVARIEAAIEADDRELLALELSDAARLQIWRGHSIVGWEVFVEAVLGLDLAEAEALRDEGGGAEPLPEELLALWMRVEAGVAEAGLDAGIVRLRDGRLHLDLDPAKAAAALANVGRRAAPFAKDAQEQPQSVVDRPKGVPRLSTLERTDD